MCMTKRIKSSFFSLFNLAKNKYPHIIEQNRMPKNYNNAKIYIIRSYQTDDVYIGSTLEKLSKRIGSHRSHFRQYMNDKYHSITYTHINILDMPCII